MEMETTTPPIIELTQLERCELLHRRDGFDFSAAFNYYLGGGDRAYFFRGPDFMIMGEHLNFDQDQNWRPHWFIWYLENSSRSPESLGRLLRYFPYRLPEVAFRRSSSKKGLQFYKMSRLLAKWEEAEEDKKQ